MNSNIKEDLESLSKKVYLEVPDLWVDFLDKVNDEIIDEMVLFFATKNNALSIVSYAIDNGIINLKAQSKNNSFKDIYEHLLHTAKQCNSTEVYNYLVNLDNNAEQVLTCDEDNLTSDEIPYFICQNCKCNIFENGYIVSENKTYTFSREHNKPIETSSKILDSVKCCNCNSIILDTTPEKLELLCSITNCSNCRRDLRDVGIRDNKKLAYDKESNTFISKHSHYACDSCNTPLKEEQKLYFNLI
ncbi:MAG: hypothetical protein ACRDA3_12505 [Peptostreptococcaceae bacterium]